MNICVYGAASSNIDKGYIDGARELGVQIAKRGHGLVFGGGATGVMGAVVEGVYENGGKIIGVAPTFFDTPGILFKDCDRFIFTETMRERKQIMEDSSDAFVVAPGGIGTFEEFFEILTLKQLGQHNKPIIMFNCNGYYDDILALLEKLVDLGFMGKECLELCSFCASVDEVFECLQ